MTASLQFAHISDIHFSKDGNRGFMLCEEAGQFLADTVERLNADPDIDFLFISGDCLNNGHQSELNRFEQVVVLSEKPVLIVPGNHDGNRSDDPQVFEQRHFAARFNPQFTQRPSQGQAGYFSMTIKPGFQFIGLDTTVPGAVGGNIEQTQLDWLTRELKAHTNDTIIVGCHHPLHPLFQQDKAGKWNNWFVCANGTNVQRVLDSSPAVKLVLYGHHHASKIFRQGEQIHIAAPAMSSYPCAYRTIKLQQQGDDWHIGWNLHIMQKTIQQKAADLLDHSDFALEFDPDDGTSYGKAAHGSALDWQFEGKIATLLNQL